MEPAVERGTTQTGPAAATPRRGTAPTRRQVLLGAAALAGSGCVSKAQPDLARAFADTATTSSTVPATAGSAATPDPLRTRLARSTFGVTESLLDEVGAEGWETWLERQLHPDEIGDDEVEASLASYDVLAMTVPERRALAEQPDQGLRAVIAPLVHATLVRAVHSQRQLREVLVDHWNNHFNTDVSAPVVALTKHDVDAAFRAGALGPFGELLLASAKSPAMLAYLDNAASRQPHPNENFGRELLELHTVGVDGGYGEPDVVSAARVFTGWTIDRTSGTFVFRSPWHDPDAKSLLGWSSPGGTGDRAVHEGEDLLAHLASLPATARHVSWRLARRLVADDPADAVVEAAASSYARSGGRIDAVVRTLLDPAFFDAHVAPKAPRPFESLTTLLRRTGARVPTDLTDRAPLGIVTALHGQLRDLGQPLFRAPAPTGYADVAEAWVSTYSVLSRWVLAATVVDRAGALEISLADLAGEATTALDAAQTIARRLWLRDPTDAEVDLLLAAAGASPADATGPGLTGGLAGLALAAGVVHER